MACDNRQHTDCRVSPAMRRTPESDACDAMHVSLLDSVMPEMPLICVTEQLSSPSSCALTSQTAISSLSHAPTHSSVRLVLSHGKIRAGAQDKATTCFVLGVHNTLFSCYWMQSFTCAQNQAILGAHPLKSRFPCVQSLLAQAT